MNTNRKRFTREPIAAISRALLATPLWIKNDKGPLTIMWVNRTHIKIVMAGFFGLLCILSAQLATADDVDDVDNDLDGYPASIDCDDDNPLWHEHCTLTAYTGCTNENQFYLNCLPNVSNVEAKLNTLHENLVEMKEDRHSWKNAYVRPGDNAPLYASKRHVQSIQYYEYDGNRYIITSISDEHNNHPAVQLIKTKGFGSEEGGTDEIVTQVVPGYLVDWYRFNHPGGSQLIGNYLFIAMEDFMTGGTPATGIFLIHNESIYPYYQVPTTNIPDDDYHQSTAGVTKLEDGTYLLAACAGPRYCDGINFYKSVSANLGLNPEFEFFYRWERSESGVLGKDGNVLPWDYGNWDECWPQNMNLIAQDDGTIYLALFGAKNNGVPRGTKVEGIDVSGCTTGIGYDDHIYGYKLEMDENYNISLTWTNKVDVMPESHICAEHLLSADPAKELHGLNFLAGSGLWLRPDGRDTIALLATEHYDTCGANDRYLYYKGLWGEGVRAKTRWGVSSNWNQLQLLTIDNSTVTVDEGQTAVNSGNFLGWGDVTLWSSVGLIVPDASSFWGVDPWSWSWPTTDGPDDSQEVEITRKGGPFLPDSKTFDLVVNNVSPTAEAGPDQIVECVYGKKISHDASGSTDPGIDSLSFVWAFMAIPAGGSAPPFFDDPTSATPSFQPSELGLYQARVTVTDDDGATNTDGVTITYEDTLPPQITAPPDITAECTAPEGTAVTLGNPTTTDACDTSPVVTNDAPDTPALFPLGTTSVTWSAVDGSGNQAAAEQYVTIQDTIPPDLTVSVNPSVLWSPNHKLVTVRADIQISDVCDGNTPIKLVSIVSNEPDNEEDDGNTVNDIQGADLGTDDCEFQLRAERSGEGNDRIYTITYEATDASGNTTLSQATVTVPISK